MMEKLNAVRSNAVDYRGGRWVRGIVVLGVLLLALAISPSAQQPPTGTPDEFVPIDRLPAQEELPAAPLVIGAYAVAWVAVFGYLWSIWQRTSRVERDLAELGRRVTPRGGSQ
jgi:CcmD family protein